MTAATIHVAKQMHSEYKSARNTYEIHKDEEIKKKTEKNSQRILVRQEIDSLKLLIAEKVRTAHFLKTESFTAMKEDEVRNNMVYVKKILLKKRDETKEEVKTLEKLRQS